MIRALPAFAASLTLFSLSLVATADETKPDGAKPAPAPAPAADPAPAKAGEIAWTKDYDAGKAKAKTDKKGLFVYLTPDWFNCGFCKKLQAAAYTDAEVQKYVNDRFVSVWVDDKKDTPFSAKLGLPSEGYPNIAVYDAEGEYVGRVIGFPGRDPWFDSLKATVARGERLETAKEAAAKDAAKWAEVVNALNDIGGREKDALSALEKVPADRRGPTYESTRAVLAAKAAWLDLEKGWKDAVSGAKTPDQVKGAAPKALEALEGWMKSHAGADSKMDATAWSRKGYLLMLQEKKEEAAAVAKKILAEWPDSPQAQAILRALR
jgi:hypothetical protein